VLLHAPEAAGGEDDGLGLGQEAEGQGEEQEQKFHGDPLTGNFFI
jgi:hypothetical protein